MNTKFAVAALTVLLASTSAHGQDVAGTDEVAPDTRVFACRERASDPLQPVIFQAHDDGYTWSRYPQISFERVGPAMIGRLEDTYYRFDAEKYVVVDWTGHVIQGECVGMDDALAQVMGEVTGR